MKKRDLLKAVLVEAVKRNLAEMPQIKRFYTLADDWENKLQNVRGYGTRFQDVALKMETLEDMNHFNVEDIKKVFKIKGTGDASTFVKALVQNGIIMPVEGAALKPKDLGIDVDDEFTVLDAPESDLTQGIDLTQALRKINIDKNVTNIDFIIRENFKVELPREEQRRLAVEYGSLQTGMRAEYGVSYNGLVMKTTTFRTNRYRFLKPFLEDKWYLKIPGEPIEIKKGWWGNNISITSLFPSLQDFTTFVKENPKSFKITTSPKNFNEIKQKVESVGGRLVPEGEMRTFISS